MSGWVMVLTAWQSPPPHSMVSDLMWCLFWIGNSARPGQCNNTPMSTPCYPRFAFVVYENYKKIFWNGKHHDVWLNAVNDGIMWYSHFKFNLRYLAWELY